MIAGTSLQRPPRLLPVLSIPPVITVAPVKTLEEEGLLIARLSYSTFDFRASGIGCYYLVQ